MHKGFDSVCVFVYLLPRKLLHTLLVHREWGVFRVLYGIFQISNLWLLLKYYVQKFWHILLSTNAFLAPWWGLMVDQLTH